MLNKTTAIRSNAFGIRRVHDNGTRRITFYHFTASGSATLNT